MAGKQLATKTRVGIGAKSLAAIGVVCSIALIGVFGAMGLNGLNGLINFSFSFDPPAATVTIDTNVPLGESILLSNGNNPVLSFYVIPNSDAKLEVVSSTKAFLVARTGLSSQPNRPTDLPVITVVLEENNTGVATTTVNLANIRSGDVKEINFKPDSPLKLYDKDQKPLFKKLTLSIRNIPRNQSGDFYLTQPSSEVKVWSGTAGQPMVPAKVGGVSVIKTGTKTMGGVLLVYQAADNPGSQLVASDNRYDLSHVMLAAQNENISIAKVTACIEDGGLNNSKVGDWRNIRNIEIRNNQGLLLGGSQDPITSNCVEVGLQSPLEIVAGSSNKLIIKGQMAVIGPYYPDQPGISGADIKVGIKNAAGVGGPGYKVVYESGMGNPVVSYRSFPQFFMVQDDCRDLSVNGPVTLLHFTVSAGANNPTESSFIRKLVFDFTKSGNMDIRNLRLSGDFFNGPYPISTTASGLIVMDNLDNIRAHGNFYITADVSDVSPGEYIKVKLLSDNVPPSNYPVPYNSLSANNNLVWSDASASYRINDPEFLTSNQWMNGYMVSGTESIECTSQRIQ